MGKPSKIIVGSLLYNLTFLVAISSLLSFVGTTTMFSAPSERIVISTIILCGLLTIFTFIATYVMLETVLMVGSTDARPGVQPRIFAVASPSR